RRDQPGPAEGPVGAARGDAGVPGDERADDASARTPVPRPRHAEPAPAPGAVPAPGGAGRPVPDAPLDRLSDGRRGADDPLPPPGEEERRRGRPRGPPPGGVPSDP